MRMRKAEEHVFLKELNTCVDLSPADGSSFELFSFRSLEVLPTLPRV